MDIAIDLILVRRGPPTAVHSRLCRCSFQEHPPAKPSPPGPMTPVSKTLRPAGSGRGRAQSGPDRNQP